MVIILGQTICKCFQSMKRCQHNLMPIRHCANINIHAAYCCIDSYKRFSIIPTTHIIRQLNYYINYKLYCLCSISDSCWPAQRDAQSQHGGDLFDFDDICGFVVMLIELNIIELASERPKRFSVHPVGQTSSNQPSHSFQKRAQSVSVPSPAIIGYKFASFFFLLINTLLATISSLSCSFRRSIVIHNRRVTPSPLECVCLLSTRWTRPPHSRQHNDYHRRSMGALVAPSATYFRPQSNIHEYIQSFVANALNYLKLSHCSHRDNFRLFCDDGKLLLHEKECFWVLDERLQWLLWGLQCHQIILKCLPAKIGRFLSDHRLQFACFPLTDNLFFLRN